MNGEKYLRTSMIFALGLLLGILLESAFFRTMESHAAKPAVRGHFDRSADAASGRRLQTLDALEPATVRRPNTGAAPRLIVDEPIYDFGAEEQGKRVLHSFVLRNEGNAPLNVRNVLPTCGCTVAQLSSKVIEPGCEVELSVSLELGLHEGRRDRAILVLSDDPEQPNLRLALVGTVVSRVARDLE